MTFSFKQFALFAIALAFAISAAPQYAAASPGDLDTTFGVLGRVYDTTLFLAKGTAVQADGKIVVVGFKSTRAGVARYNSDGSPDYSFGNQGLVLAAPVYSIFYGVALQEDGKIVAVGRNDNSAFVVRLNANGTFDSTFSGDGRLLISFATTFYAAELTDVAIVPNSDKIVVAGTVDFDSDDYPCVEGANLALARINGNGTLDTSFDGNGKKAIDLSCRDVLTSMAVHPSNGKIAFTTQGHGDFEVGMLNANGSFDTGFGGDGIVETDFNGTSYQDDGAETCAFQQWFVLVGGLPGITTRLVVGGDAYGSSATVYDSALARYKMDGSLDTAFDGDGKVRKSLTYQWDSIETIEIDSQQRIVTAGPRGWDGKYDFSVMRFTRDGAYDTTFGSGGKVYTQFFLDGVRTGSFPHDVALAPDGKIVAAGSGVGLDAIMARYEP